MFSCGIFSNDLLTAFTLTLTPSLALALPGLALRSRSRPLSLSPGLALSFSPSLAFALPLSLSPSRSRSPSRSPPSRYPFSYTHWLFFPVLTAVPHRCVIHPNSTHSHRVVGCQRERPVSWSRTQPSCVVVSSRPHLDSFLAPALTHAHAHAHTPSPRLSFAALAFTSATAAQGRVPTRANPYHGHDRTAKLCGLFVSPSPLATPSSCPPALTPAPSLDRPRPRPRTHHFASPTPALAFSCPHHRYYRSRSCLGRCSNLFHPRFSPHRRVPAGATRIMVTNTHPSCVVVSFTLGGTLVPTLAHSCALTRATRSLAITITTLTSPAPTSPHLLPSSLPPLQLTVPPRYVIHPNSNSFHPSFSPHRRCQRERPVSWSRTHIQAVWYVSCLRPRRLLPRTRPPSRPPSLPCHHHHHPRLTHPRLSSPSPPSPSPTATVQAFGNYISLLCSIE